MFQANFAKTQEAHSVFIYSENAAIFEIMWKIWQRRQAKSENTILGMCFACRITKTTNTQSEYLTLIPFLKTTTLRRKNLNFSFISAQLILFVSLNEMWSKSPLPATLGKNWCKSLRTTTCSGEPDSKLWISKPKKTVKLQWFKLKEFRSPELWHRFLLFFLQATGPRPWFVRMHSPNCFENNLDCVVVYYGYPQGNFSVISIQAYQIRWVHNIHCLFTNILSL